MKIQTFIFVHDQNIILDFKQVNKFNELENLKYVFVGAGEIDKIDGLDDVIISRNLPGNIEQYPKLTSFTGWYSLWKNNLVDGDYINLFEYDINILDNFVTEQKKVILNKAGVIGYIPYNIHSYPILGNPIWCQYIVDSIKKNYGIDVISRISLLSNSVQCSMTSNHTFNKKNFDNYMKWVEPMIDDIKLSPYSGHDIERSIFLYYTLNKIQNVFIIPNIIKHYNFDSHQTQLYINQDVVKETYKELL